MGGSKEFGTKMLLGDDTVEAPRFMKVEAFKNVGGLDTNVGGGGDDWIYIRN